MANVPKSPPNSNFPDLSTLWPGLLLGLVGVLVSAVVREAFRVDRERRSTPPPSTCSASPSGGFTRISLAIDFRRDRERLGVDGVALVLAVEVDVALLARDARVFGEEGALPASPAILSDEPLFRVATIVRFTFLVLALRICGIDGNFG